MARSAGARRPFWYSVAFRMKPGIRKLLFPLLMIGIWSGCASSAPPLPPSLRLPAPVTDLRAARKGDKVYLAWTPPAQTTDQEAIRQPGSTLICRSLQPVMQQCGTPVATVAGRAPAGANGAPAQSALETYTVPIPSPSDVQPQDEATYAVEVLNDRGRHAGLSNQVRVPLLPAVPPPTGFHAELTARGMEISWTCPPVIGQQFPGVEYRLRILRRQEGSEADVTVAEPDLLDCTALPILDSAFTWEKTYFYHAAAVSIVAEPGKPALEIEGDDTPTVRIFANDVFPPSVPSGLQAVFSGAGKESFVDLIWSPDTDADLAGYNVYRHEEGGQAVKLNTEPVKVPAYRDANVQSGKKYFYSVSAVDVRGNESARSPEASEEVP
jgi:hypothetical protein